MKTSATVTGPKGKVSLIFGVYGLKNFCKRLGCEPTISSVFSAFQGGTRLEAITEIIRSGMEQHSADAGEIKAISDYEACEILETAKEAEATKAMGAFFSSILNEDYDAWFARLTAQAAEDEASTEEQADNLSEEEKKS